MGLYAERILPRLLHIAMKNKQASRLRAKHVPAAEGRVLEIGIGSGLNLPFYGAGVSEVVAIEPSAKLAAMARANGAKTATRLDLREGSAETLPFDPGSFDCVLSTWTLCSIPDVAAALSELRRVLKPAGRMIFVEHGKAPEPRVARGQDRLNPLWGKLAGGCNINRPIDHLVEAAGFEIGAIETGYLIKGPRVLSYHYAGTARPR